MNESKIPELVYISALIGGFVCFMLIVVHLLSSNIAGDLRVILWAYVICAIIIFAHDNNLGNAS